MCRRHEWVAARIGAVHLVPPNDADTPFHSCQKGTGTVAGVAQ